MSRNLAQPPLLPRSASASMVRGGTSRSPSRGMLLFGTVVVLGTLLPLSVLNRTPTACPDMRIEAGEESAQLAVLAQLAQHNEELLRGLANSDNVSSLTDTAPAVRKEEADNLAVAAAAQGGGAPPVRTAPIHYSAPGIWLRMAIMSVGRKDNSEYLLRTLASWQVKMALPVLVVPQLTASSSWGGLSLIRTALCTRDARLRRPGPMGGCGAAVSRRLTREAAALRRPTRRSRSSSSSRLTTR